MITKFRRLVEIVMKEIGISMKKRIDEQHYFIQNSEVKFWDGEDSVFDFYIRYKNRDLKQLLIREVIASEVLEVVKSLLDDDDRVRLKKIKVFSNVRSVNGGNVTLNVYLEKAIGISLKKLRRYSIIAGRM